MKKLYFLTAIFLICFVNSGLSQYTATNSGNWSSPITWAPGAPPSGVCNNCLVTINSGVTVQVDAHTEFAGTSILTLQDNAQLVIGNSSQTTIGTGFNIVMDTLPGNSMIVLTTTTSKISAVLAGTYDGIFVGPLPNSLYQKVIGNAPSLFQGNNVIVSSPPAYGSSLTGSHVLFSGGTLPISLKSFNAFFNDNVVSVSWATDLQLNLSHFIVLRSGDGSSWEAIGNVAAKSSSSGGADYSFTDPSPLPGINYYRLRSVDNNGVSKFSEIKFIHGLFIKGLRFGPNPAKDNLHVIFGSDISTKLTLRLVNQSGQLLQQKQISNAAGTTVVLQVSNYPQGIYTLHIKGADGSQNSYRVLITR